MFPGNLGIAPALPTETRLARHIWIALDKIHSQTLDSTT